MKSEKKRLLSDLHNNKEKSFDLKSWLREKHKLGLWLVGGVVLITTLVVNLDGI